VSSVPSTAPPGSRIAASPAVVDCPRPGGALLLDVGQGRRITLDFFGSRLWSELQQEPTLATLLTVLRDDGASTERLAEDVARLLARWRAGGVITWH